MMTDWIDVKWGGFPVLPSSLVMAPRNIDRSEAWRRHRERLRLLPERLSTLDQLAEFNGFLIGGRGQRDCESLERWVHRIAMAHGALLTEPDEPLLSLIHDAGMMFGDELIARFPTLSWQLKRGTSRNVYYHHTVIAGYSRSANRNLHTEPVFSYIAGLKSEFFGAARFHQWASMLRLAETRA